MRTLDTSAGDGHLTVTLVIAMGFLWMDSIEWLFFFPWVLAQGNVAANLAEFLALRLDGYDTPSWKADFDVDGYRRGSRYD